MPQSMLAVIAMMMAIMLTHLQQRSVVRSQLGRVQGEVGLQTLGVAQDKLSEVGGEAFDEATVGSGEPSGPSALTDTTDFGPAIEAAGSNDMDDYDGETFAEWRLAGDDSLSFQVKVEVDYVDESDPDTEVLGPTRTKRITAIAWNTNLADPDTIRLSLPYSCGSKCSGPGW